MEKIVGHQGQGIERAIVLVAVVDHLDRRHAGADGIADLVPVVGRARRGQIPGECHGDLALDPDPKKIGVAKLARPPLHAWRQHAAGAGVVDAEEALHHRRGAADLVACQRAAPGRIEPDVQGVLDGIGLGLAFRPEAIWQAGKARAPEARLTEQLRRLVDRLRLHALPSLALARHRWDERSAPAARRKTHSCLMDTRSLQSATA